MKSEIKSIFYPGGDPGKSGGNLWKAGRFPAGKSGGEGAFRRKGQSELSASGVLEAYGGSGERNDRGV